MKHFSQLAGLSEYKCFLHAEVLALLRTGTKRAHSIYIARVCWDGSVAMAKPCPACQKAIEAFQIKEVHFTTGSYENN